MKLTPVMRLKSENAHNQLVLLAEKCEISSGNVYKVKGPNPAKVNHDRVLLKPVQVGDRYFKFLWT